MLILCIKFIRPKGTAIRRPVSEIFLHRQADFAVTLDLTNEKQRIAFEYKTYYYGEC